MWKFHDIISKISTLFTQSLSNLVKDFCVSTIRRFDPKFGSEQNEVSGSKSSDVMS